VDEGSQAMLLSIYIGESDRWHGKRLHQALVEAAREQGLAGATVLQGIMGFGANSRNIHTARLVDVSPDLPIVVEIVDDEPKIRSFLATAGTMIAAGLVTLQQISVLIYRHPGGAS
jgi:PII-like signaling protein